MTKLELLNVFLNDRLTAAAEDIFRAVKDTVVEYESEIVRSKQENERLKRLLSVAVQRLLQPGPGQDHNTAYELHSVQSKEDGHPSESDGGSSVELLLPYIKKEPEPGHIQSGCSQEAGDLEKGSCSRVEQRSRLSPAQTVCRIQSTTPPLTYMNPESEREDNRTQPAGSNITVHSSQSRSQCTTAKTHRIQQTEQFVHSSVKQSPHRLQIKNVRSLRAPALRSSHPNQSVQRWHSCKECGKGFSFACQLEVHMRWHTKEKPYSCAVCRKSFTTVSMLKRHHRIHTGEKPFRCHICGKCFNQSAHLNTHFRLHTKERAGWSRAPHCK